MGEGSKLSRCSDLTEIRFAASRNHRHMKHHVLPAVLVVRTDDDKCLEGKVEMTIKRLFMYILIYKHYSLLFSSSQLYCAS